MVSEAISAITRNNATCKDLFLCLYNLAPPDLDSLVILLRSKAALTLDELAEQLQRDRSTAFRSVQKLTMMGLCSKQARSLREGGYYHVYQVSDARTIRRVTKQKVEEIQIGLDRLLRRFEDDLNEMIAPKSLKVLVVEDEPDIALSYKMVLENNGHRVIVANTGEDCLKMYRLALLNVSPGDTETQPFDSLILDYRLPGIDGMQVAKEILSLNPDQRIIFASAYVKETLVDSIRNLKQVVELIQKPFEPDVLVETVEDREVHAKLGKLIVDMGGAELDAEGEQIRNLFESLRKLQKGRTF